MTVLTLTLNAAIDKRYDLPTLGTGQVQRITRVHASAGGKGVNVARGARLCGQPVIASGFIAGYAGQFVAAGVSGMGVREEFVRVAGETRTCLNIIDAAGLSTELLEPGVTVTRHDVDTLVERVRALAREVDVVTMSGSVPDGCPTDVYATLIEAVAGSGRSVILDTSGVHLREGLRAGPTVVKPNRNELAALAGDALPTQGDVIRAARLVCDLGAHATAVSLGEEGALLVTREYALCITAPQVKVVNAVGCGDVLVSGIATGLATGLTLGAAVELGVRVSAAAAAHPETGRFDPTFASSLTASVSTTQL